MEGNPLSAVKAVSPESPIPVKRALLKAIADQNAVLVKGKQIALRWRPGTQPPDFDGIRRPDDTPFKYQLASDTLSGKALGTAPGFGGQHRLILMLTESEAVLIPLNDVETGLAG